MRKKPSAFMRLFLSLAFCFGYFDGFKTGSSNFNSIANTNTSKKTYTELYVLNTSYINMNNALRMVGQKIDDVNMPDEAKNSDYDYAYTGTIAAVEAKSEGGTESVWVIAVSITQTASAK